MPTLAMNRPISSETTPLSGASVEMKTAQVRPSSTSQKYSAELNLSANSASAGADDDQHRGAEQAADRRGHEAGAERQLGLALAGHRVGVVGVGGGRRRAGNAQQRARDVAGEDRHRARGDDRADRRHRLHEEGHRHQQRGRHRRGQPGSAPTTRPNTDASSMTTITYGSRHQSEGLLRRRAWRFSQVKRLRARRAAAAPAAAG